MNGDRLDIDPLEAKILKATCLTHPAAAVTAGQTASGISMGLPPGQHDPVDTVIALQLSRNASDEMPNGRPQKSPAIK